MTQPRHGTLLPSAHTMQPPAVVASAAARAEADMVIRPAAVLSETHAREILAFLDASAVDQGGVWSTGGASGVWQRYDRPWTGPGTNRLVGSIYVTYDMPRSREVVLHRVQVEDHGLMLGWTTTRLVDELLARVGLSIATCPRDTTAPPSYAKDPFRRRDAYVL